MFLTNFMLNIFFDPPKHERFQYCMKPLDLNFVQFFLILTMGLNILGKPLVELFVGVKQFRHNKVKKSPKFSHIILDGCPCQKKSAP